MLQLSESVRMTIEQDGGVLLDVAQGKLLRLNRTGASLLELLANCSEPETLAVEFARRWDIPLDKARKDVAEFLASLKSQGILRSDGQGRN